MTSPCYKCQERQHLCHATCEAYSAWREEYKRKQDRDKSLHTVGEIEAVARWLRRTVNARATGAGKNHGQRASQGGKR